MEFIILRDAEVTFSGVPIVCSSSGGLVRRDSGVLDVEIQATKNNDDGTDNQIYANDLTTALIENPLNIKNKKTKMDWNLKVAIALPQPVRTADKLHELGILIVYSKSDESMDVKGFLQILHDVFNVEGGNDRNVTLNVVVKNFGLKKKSSDNPSSINWEAEGQGLMLRGYLIDNVEFAQSACVLMSTPSKRILKAWKRGQEFCATFTISVVLSNSAFSFLESMNILPMDRYEHFRNMLENEICTDLEILAGASPDQKVVKCHRAVLATGSEVFRRMFESGMKEATENKIKLEDMSEEGVRAMLAYLYYRDTTAVYGSSEIALELLQAGEKYDVQDLKESVREYMMAKENRWFGVEMVLTLFVFVKALCSDKEDEILDEEDFRGNIEDVETKSGQGKENEEQDDDDEIEAWRSLKIKCLKVLTWYMKKKPKTLLGSAKYQEIFGGNLKLGMEVTSAILRLD